MSRIITHITPAMQSVIDTLTEDGDMEAREIADMTGLSLKTLVDGSYLNQMIRMGAIRISKYERSRSGEPVATYSVTPGKSAVPPARMTEAERSRRWRKTVGFGTAEFKRGRALRELLRVMAWNQSATTVQQPRSELNGYFSTVLMD